MAEAGEKNNVLYTRILSNCADRKNSVNGMIFVYEENAANVIKPTITVVSDPDVKQCLICGEKYDSYSKLSGHIRPVHGMLIEDYTIKYLYNGVKPKCPVDGCEQHPRYSTYSYKTYCKDHSYVAESEAGRIGGKLGNKKK